jgi:hypothetical protein
MKTKKYILNVLIFTLCSLCLSSCIEKPDPVSHFKRYILDPIPKSVKNIKIDQTSMFNGYAYLFGFDIEREDVNLIIESNSLTKKTVRYSNGYFDVDNVGRYNRISLIVYGSRKQAEWFNPELWTNPDAYVYYKRIDTHADSQILLFNEEENKAYFFIKHY